MFTSLKNTNHRAYASYPINYILRLKVLKTFFVWRSWKAQEEENVIEQLSTFVKWLVDKRLRQTLLELDSDDTFVKPFHWCSISQAYTEFYMLKTSQGQWLWMCIVIFIRMLKALNTYTHNKPCSRLIHLISRLINIYSRLTPYYSRLSLCLRCIPTLCFWFVCTISRLSNLYSLSLIHIWRCRRSTLCRSRWSPYH